MLQSRFSLSPPVNRGAYPESRGDFWGAIWGYNSRISYPPVNRGKCTKKKAGEEAQRMVKEEAKCAAKEAQRDVKWTADVDATIVRMIGEGSSYSDIVF